MSEITTPLADELEADILGDPEEVEEESPEEPESEQSEEDELSAL